jgi:hypothetical protein
VIPLPKPKIRRASALLVAAAAIALLNACAVLDRADDYNWAIVGEPSGRY